MADAAKWDANFLWFPATRSMSRRSHSDWFFPKIRMHTVGPWRCLLRGYMKIQGMGFLWGFLLESWIWHTLYTYIKISHQFASLIRAELSFTALPWLCVPVPLKLAFKYIVSASNKGGWVFQHHTKWVVLVVDPFQHVWATVKCWRGVFPVPEAGKILVVALGGVDLFNSRVLILGDLRMCPKSLKA